ncbi:hypothetical protein [Flavobacterium sp. 5]|uniref:hypothetical protein n=1 Tax=Flavobacterium sp. 5 TaxID=2035199 RepID=UPI000C2BA341|nr:hypothetical protein [Flavobacterium sp. 5]PKB15111.1 hypothetical protein CLU82_0171 [Flavobacterium sp. 5]
MNKKTVDVNLVFSKIGRCLVAAQRIELASGEILKFLAEYDKDLYNLTSEEFLKLAGKTQKTKMTLGNIFKLLKLNPNLVIEEELNSYLQKRNMLVHNFLTDYLHTVNVKQAKKAEYFCDDFLKHSALMESFFKGFLNFILLPPIPEDEEPYVEESLMTEDFYYFISHFIKYHPGEEI